MGMIFGLLTFQNLATAQTWNSLTPLPDGYSLQSLTYSSNFLYQVGGNSTMNGLSPAWKRVLLTTFGALKKS